METDLIHRDELRCRAEAWAEDVFAGEPDNCKYNSLLYLIDDSEVVGVADVETEKLIAALRKIDCNGEMCHVCPCDSFRKYENSGACDDGTRIAAALALEVAYNDNAAKDAEIERLKEQIEADSQLKSGLDNANALCRTYKADRDRLQAELDAAIEDFESAAHNGNILCEFCGADCIDAGNDTVRDTDQCGCFVYRGRKHD